MSWPHEVPLPANCVPQQPDPSAFMRDHMDLSHRYARLILDGHADLCSELREQLGLNGKLTGPIIADALLWISDEQREHLKNLMRNEIFVHAPRMRS